MDLSIVIPLYNESESLPELMEWINRVLEKRKFEVVFVDDGSKDESWSVIQELRTHYPGKVKGIKFARNYGKSAGLQKGFEAAIGSVVFTMDADLQDSPDEILVMEKLLHDPFADGRTRSTREFFEVNPERVISALRLTKGHDVTPRADIVEDEESRRALARTNKMREAFNFGMVGIAPGTILTFIRDPSETCEVLTNKMVLFEGKETSLSASALVLLKRSGWNANKCAGPVY